MRALQIRMIAMVILTGVTLALFGMIERYQASVSEALQNPDFSDGLKGWKASGSAIQLRLDDGVLRIQATSGERSIGVRQRIVRGPDMNKVRLSAWVKYDGVGTGQYSWNGARLILVQQDGKGKNLWELPHTVMLETGDGPWRLFSRIIWLPQQTKTVEVVAILNQVPGQMQVRDLTLEIVAEKSAFTMARHSLTAVWLLLLPWLAWPLYRPGANRRGRLAIAGVAAVILLGALTPHAVKSQLRHIAVEAVDMMKGPQTQTYSKSLRTQPKPTIITTVTDNTDGSFIADFWSYSHKSGHVILFVVFAVVVTLTWRKPSCRRQAVYIGSFAVTAEILQLLSIDRTADIKDAGLNLLGVSAGLLLGRYLIRRQGRIANDIFKDEDLPGA